MNISRWPAGQSYFTEINSLPRQPKLKISTSVVTCCVRRTNSLPGELRHVNGDYRADPLSLDFRRRHFNVQRRNHRCAISLPSRGLIKCPFTAGLDRLHSACNNTGVTPGARLRNSSKPRAPPLTTSVAVYVIKTNRITSILEISGFKLSFAGEVTRTAL